MLTKYVSPLRLRGVYICVVASNAITKITKTESVNWNANGY